MVDFGGLSPGQNRSRCWRYAHATLVLNSNFFYGADSFG
jgi:hypothetical protein